MSKSNSKLKFRKVTVDNRKKNNLVVGRPITEADNTDFQENVQKYKDLLSWMIFYPDLFLDLMTPEKGGIKLHYDQRIFLRVVSRYLHVYGVFNRSYGKTFLELLAFFVIAITHPNIRLSITAQTKENACKILVEKYTEIVEFYPFFKEEIVKVNFSVSSARVFFKNGAIIDALANQQSSKGLRRHRLNVEESNLIDQLTFEDALEPIPDMPRPTVGYAGIANPEELNRQINFFTTSGYRASYEYTRNMNMLKEMVNLEGSFVMGSGWMLSGYYGRGVNKNSARSKYKSNSRTSFDMNYNSKWVGASDSALVDINKLMSLQTLKKPEFKYNSDDNCEYFIGVDVARSDSNKKTCQTVVAVGKVLRKKNGRIRKVQLVYMTGIRGTENFTEQSIKIKKIKQDFNAKIVVVDGNGLGQGLRDELMKVQVGTNYNGDEVVYEAWNTINTDAQPERPNTAIACMFDFLAQTYNSELIGNFMSMVQDSKIELLTPLSTNINEDDISFTGEEQLPFWHTKWFVDEVNNLKYRENPKTKKLEVEPVVKATPKDRYSAISMMLWYIGKFEDTEVDENLSNEDFWLAYANL